MATIKLISSSSSSVSMLLVYKSSKSSQSFSTASSIVGHGEAGAYLQQSMGERRGTPWTGHQSIAGQHRLTQDKQPCTHSVTLKDSQWTVGGSRSTRTCKRHAERPPAGSRCRATVLTTAPQCSPQLSTVTERFG
ncbi:hypothetical protein ILYODFUR_009232 [Ilyodon furcidens]|uniref:Uncharacterized protein n=1 Tax=Ilyodon furcidens TaxID=33524 RepID=A0ABV0UGG1_9TELE